jgi:hypothetical protein
MKRLHILNVYFGKSILCLEANIHVKKNKRREVEKRGE